MPDTDGSSRVTDGSGRRPVDDATYVPMAGSAAGGSTADIGRELQGTMLGPYRLDTFIGGGGMGAVFRSLDTTLDRVVAVKVLARHQSADEEMLRRFRNEAQSAARLDHENIGRVHAVGSERGWHYIVFEFIEGTNLRDLVAARGPFDLARAVDVTIQVAEALEHASQRDVVHRDIKPSNIVITPAGKARVVDMGLARLAPTEQANDLTQSGMTLGTFDYIAPEQARDPRAADVRSDLYSLGCTIYFMLTGRPPFAEGTLVQKLLQHQQEKPPDIEMLRPDVPHRFAEILERLMEKDPDARYQRPAVLVAELTAFATEQGLSLGAPRSSPVVPPAVRGESTRGSMLPWLVPAAGLLAVVGGLWARSAALRRGGDLAGPGPAPVVGATRPLGPRILRVVDVPASVDEATSLGDAIRMAADGDVVELVSSGTRLERPLDLRGRRLTIRAAADSRPVVRFAGAGQDAPSIACDIGEGALVIRGVGFTLESPRRGAGGALFAVAGGTLSCEDVLLELVETGSSGEGGGDVQPAFVLLVPGGGDEGCRVEFDEVRAVGTGDVFVVNPAMEGVASLRWTGGGCVTPRHLLVAEGATTVRSSGDGPLVECRFDRTRFACGAGVAMLRDSSARPAVPRLRLTATRMDVEVGAGQPILEQSGIADPDTYRATVDWNAASGSYVGTAVFRRIDGSAERVESGFEEEGGTSQPAAVPPPDPAAWVEEWLAGPVRRGPPDAAGPKPRSLDAGGSDRF